MHPPGSGSIGTQYLSGRNVQKRIYALYPFCQADNYAETRKKKVPFARVTQYVGEIGGIPFSPPGSVLEYYILEIHTWGAMLMKVRYAMMVIVRADASVCPYSVSPN